MAIDENKLYPPYLEGTIPAFTFTKVEDTQKIFLEVPFTMNRAVSTEDVDSYSLLVKKVSSNKVIGTVLGGPIDYNNFSVAVFDVSKLDLQIGQYYKVQLAYKDANGVIGYYSTPAIVRYIKEPKTECTFEVDEMRAIGTFEPNGSGEFLYSIRFYLLNETNSIIEDSGEILYNSSNIDNEGNSIESYQFKTQSVYGNKYKVKFVATTGNKYVCEVKSEELTAVPSVRPETQLEVIATNNYDDGYIEVAVKPLKESKGKITGVFRLGRATSKDDFLTYEPLMNFEFIDEIPDKVVFKDLYIEHNIEYKYAIQQYNSSEVYSKKTWSNKTTALFEDMFLCGQGKQLNLRFNPKVTSIKATIQETRVDTLGGKYPFIFRNGQTNYKELPLSGLISYLMDINEMFMTRPQNFVGTTSLTNENIAVERDFKMAVLNWLNNGEVKYFKSPIEGSMLVRLMNVSLSPNDTVGRMLHTFSATAYEVGELTFDNLVNYKFINNEEILSSTNTISIGQQQLKANNNYNYKDVYYLEFLVNQDSTDTEGTTLTIDSRNIIIPCNIKSYRIEQFMSTITISTNKTCEIIYQKKNNKTCYDNDFNKIKGVKVIDSLNIRQFYGDNTDIIKALEADSGKEVSYFTYLQFYKNIKKTKDFVIHINGNEIDITDTRDYLLKNIDYIDSLTLGEGVILECGYYLLEKELTKV